MLDRKDKPAEYPLFNIRALRLNPPQHASSSASAPSRCGDATAADATAADATAADGAAADGAAAMRFYERLGDEQAAAALASCTAASRRAYSALLVAGQGGLSAISLRRSMSIRSPTARIDLTCDANTAPTLTHGVSEGAAEQLLETGADVAATGHVAATADGAATAHVAATADVAAALTELETKSLAFRIEFGGERRWTVHAHADLWGAEPFDLQGEGRTLSRGIQSVAEHAVVTLAGRSFLVSERSASCAGAAEGDATRRRKGEELTSTGKRCATHARNAAPIDLPAVPDPPPQP